MSTFETPFNTELELQEQIIDRLTQLGWSVEKEVECDEKFSEKSCFRADLIIQHDRIPQLGPIGIEVELIKGSANGAVVAKGFEQVIKYSGKKFGGREIKIWALAVFSNGATLPDDSEIQISYHLRGWGRVSEFLGFFVNHFGFGYIDLNKFGVDVFFGNGKWIPLFSRSQHQNDDKRWSYCITNSMPTKILDLTGKKYIQYVRGSKLIKYA